jgi:hypothetical protein
VNVAPVLPVIPTNVVNELTLLTVTNTASESDLHASITRYRLINAPVDMVISANGIITWTPNQNQSPGTKTIITVVYNNDPYDLVNPVLTATNSFTVVVQNSNLPVPVIQSITLTNGVVTIVWSTVANHIYQLQYKSNLTSTSWNKVTPDVTATSQTASATNAVSTATQQFYRVLVVQ